MAGRGMRSASIRSMRASAAISAKLLYGISTMKMRPILSTTWHPYSSSMLEDWSESLNVSRLMTSLLEPFVAFCSATLANDGESFMNSLFSWATNSSSALATDDRSVQHIEARKKVRREVLVRVVIILG